MGVSLRNVNAWAVPKRLEATNLGVRAKRQSAKAAHEVHGLASQQEWVAIRIGRLCRRATALGVVRGRRFLRRRSQPPSLPVRLQRRHGHGASFLTGWGVPPGSSRETGPCEVQITTCASRPNSLAWKCDVERERTKVRCHQQGDSHHHERPQLCAHPSHVRQFRTFHATQQLQGKHTLLKFGLSWIWPNRIRGKLTSRQREREAGSPPRDHSNHAAIGS
jgi:hypothetical protein